MAWVVTLHATLKGTRPQPKLATHCTIPIHEAVGNGPDAEAPRVRLRRYPSSSHENLFLGKKIQKKQTGQATLKGTRPQPLLGAYGARRGVAAAPGGVFEEAPWVRVLGSHDLLNKFTFYYSTQVFFTLCHKSPN